MAGLHRSVAEAVAGRLASDPAVRSVLLGGSVGRGTEEDDSDVDLLLIAENRKPMERQLIDDLLVEVVAKTEAGWSGAFRRPRPMWIYSMLAAEVLVDDGAALAVQSDARRALAEYRTPAEVLGELSVLLWHGRAKVRRAERRGGIDAGYWAAVMTPSALDSLYAVHDRPPPPGSLRLDLLGELPLSQEDRINVECILSAHAPEERIAAVAALTDSLMERLPAPDLLAT